MDSEVFLVAKLAFFVGLVTVVSCGSRSGCETRKRFYSPNGIVAVVRANNNCDNDSFASVQIEGLQSKGPIEVFLVEGRPSISVTWRSNRLLRVDYAFDVDSRTKEDLSFVRKMIGDVESIHIQYSRICD